MSRKAVAALMVVVFVVSSTGCMTWRHKDIRTTADYPRPNKGIVGVVMRSGEVIRFSRAAPARIVGDRVVGTPASLGERDVEIEGPFPLVKRLADGTVTEVTDANGRVWLVRKVLKEEPNRMTVRIADPTIGAVAIPLSEIAKVKIMRSNPALTFLSGLALAGAAWFVGLAISLGKA